MAATNTTATIRPVPQQPDIAPPPPSALEPVPANMTASAPHVDNAPDAPPPDNISLSELDEKLAAEMDQMLQGNFESIDAVLQGVFEEQAVLVQNPDGTAGAPTRQTALNEPPSPISAEPIAAAAHVVPIASVEAPANIAPPESPPAAAFAAPEPIHQTMREAPAPVEPIAAPAVPATPQAPDRPTVAAPTVAAERKRSAFTVIGSVVVLLLMIVNYPMRWLPPGLRPVMNWTAFSLLLWVPIVWAMVIMMHESPPSTAPHEDETPSSQPAPMHGESGQAPAPQPQDSPAGH